MFFILNKFCQLISLFIATLRKSVTISFSGCACARESPSSSAGLASLAWWRRQNRRLRAIGVSTEHLIKILFRLFTLAPLRSREITVGTVIDNERK